MTFVQLDGSVYLFSTPCINTAFRDAFECVLYDFGRYIVYLCFMVCWLYEMEHYWDLPFEGEGKESWNMKRRLGVCTIGVGMQQFYRPSLGGRRKTKVTVLS